MKKNNTLGTGLPVLSKAEKEKLVPKKLELERAIDAGNKPKAQKLFTELKPAMSDGLKESLKGKINKISSKSVTKKK